MERVEVQVENDETIQFRAKKIVAPQMDEDNTVKVSQLLKKKLMKTLQ
jgi:phenolic acid decarboxylase